MNNTLLEHTFVAHNDAIDSGNPMHDDDAARALAFDGALVPGVTVFGYMTHVVVAHFGEEWLDCGGMEVRFRRPVYVDDRLCVTGVVNSDATLSVNATNAAGDCCVSGRAAMTAAGGGLAALLTTEPPPDLPLAGTKRPATRAACAANDALGTIDACFEPAAAAAFVSAMQDTHACYGEGVTHPAWLLRQANLVVDANLALGPWIHVGSELINRRRCRNGEALRVRARFVDLYTRKGSDYADLDVALVGAETPEDVVMRVLHRFIYRYAPAAAASG